MTEVPSSPVPSSPVPSSPVPSSPAPSSLRLAGRRGPLIAAVAAAALGLTACGSSDKKSSSAPTKPAAPVRAISVEVAHTLPLKLSIAETVAKVGPPQRIANSPATLPPKKKGGKAKQVTVLDYYYAVKGGKAGEAVDLTFYKGKLASVLITTAGNAGAAAAAGGIGGAAPPPSAPTATNGSSG